MHIGLHEFQGIDAYSVITFDLYLFSWYHGTPVIQVGYNAIVSDWETNESFSVHVRPQQLSAC